MHKHDRYGKPATPYLEEFRSPDFCQGFDDKKKTKFSYVEKGSHGRKQFVVVENSYHAYKKVSTHRKRFVVVEKLIPLMLLTRITGWCREKGVSVTGVKWLVS